MHKLVKTERVTVKKQGESQGDRLTFPLEWRNFCADRKPAMPARKTDTRDTCSWAAFLHPQLARSISYRGLVPTGLEVSLKSPPSAPQAAPGVIRG